MAISVFDMRKYIVHIALLHKFLLCNLKCLENNPLTDGKGRCSLSGIAFLDGKRREDGQYSIWRCFPALYKDDGGYVHVRSVSSD